MQTSPGTATTPALTCQSPPSHPQLPEAHHSQDTRRRWGRGWWGRGVNKRVHVPPSLPFPTPGPPCSPIMAVVMYRETREQAPGEGGALAGSLSLAPPAVASVLLHTYIHTYCTWLALPPPQRRGPETSYLLRVQLVAHHLQGVGEPNLSRHAPPSACSLCCLI